MCSGETFDTDSIKAHNSCISEAQKHQGSMYKGPKAKQQQQPKAAAAPAPVAANGKRTRHALDSSSDEEEEEEPKKEKESSKKPKKEEPAVTVAAPAAPAAAAKPAAFDALASVQAALSKKGGSLSLKKLRKAFVKAAEPAGKDKEAATKLLVEALLDNASNVTIAWSNKKDE